MRKETGNGRKEENKDMERKRKRRKGKKIWGEDIKTILMLKGNNTGGRKERQGGWELNQGCWEDRWEI